MNQLAQQQVASLTTARAQPGNGTNTNGGLALTSRTTTIAVLLILFGYLPLLIEHFLNLWARPHYQFVVFLPVLAWSLARQRLRRSDSGDASGDADAAWNRARPSSAFVWGPLFLLSFITLATATYLRSPWLAMSSALLTGLALILAIGGWRLLGQLFPAWLMMAMALPLPSNLDVRLITSLRELTTHFSSAVLDEFGILHLTSGSVIELPATSLFIADACTGIHSLFVLVACALFVGFWMRRSIPHFVLLVVATFGIVLVENVVRVVGLAMALNYFGIDLSEGWPHAVFGVLLFATSLLFVLSADRLFAFFWPSIPWVLPYHWLRRWRGWRQTWRPAAIAEESAADATASGSPAMAAIGARRLLLPLAAGFAVLGLLQLMWMPTRAEQLVRLLQRHPLDLPEYGADALPEEWNGWQLQGYELVQRVVEDPMGEFSQVWTFQNNEIKAVVSLDYPFQQKHDLTSCYRAIGWGITGREICEEDVAAGQPFALARMNRQLHGPRLLYFSLYDTAGQCEVRFKEELTLDEVLEKRFDSSRPWFQVQLLAAGPRVFSPEDEEKLRTFFLNLRGLLRDRCLQELRSPHEG